jgi:hypothetical protein
MQVCSFETSVRRLHDEHGGDIQVAAETADVQLHLMESMYVFVDSPPEVDALNRHTLLVFSADYLVSA